MPVPTVKIKFVHPFIRYERDFELDEVYSSLSKLMEIILEDTKAHGRFARRGRQQFDRLRGCIVMRGRAEVGHFTEYGFEGVDPSEDMLTPDEEIIVMLPITGG
ncbi:MAG: hypothetical protein ACFFD6_04260 [Candidatus Thorarchaeota archaeon]